MAWVVFENGTVFYTVPTDELPAHASLDAIAEAAREALRELGPAVPGSSSADFNTIHLSGWFPDEFVYFVTYDHEAIASIVVRDSESDLAAGLEGRASRDADLEAMDIAIVRGFDGSQHVAAPG